MTDTPEERYEKACHALLHACFNNRPPSVIKGCVEKMRLAHSELRFRLVARTLH